MNRVAAMAPEITWHSVTFLSRRAFDALHLSTQESLSRVIQSSFFHSPTLCRFSQFYLFGFFFFFILENIGAIGFCK